MKNLIRKTLALAAVLCAQVPTQAQVEPVAPSPHWKRAMPNGPDTSVNIAEE